MPAAQPGQQSSAADPDAAESVAVRILGGAAQSAEDLRRRLVRRGFDAAAAEAAVERCREHGYVDDSALAASIAGRHTRRGHGMARAAADLRRRGISRAVIDGSLLQMLGDEEATARNAAQALLERERKRGSLDERALRRVAAALQRRGFSTELVRKVLRTLPQD
ncbi:MAG: regulatory protein RecX [Candidatus Dormibacteraeota bacterium]|nr:regulatory protein RecX [Candidatus Dormibacteraeota bacterium]